MPKHIKITQEKYNLYKRLLKKNRIFSDSYQDLQMKVLLLKILTDAHFDLGSESPSLLERIFLFRFINLPRSFMPVPIRISS